MTLPILYSFRRCPYAIRARMALNYSGIKVELREVLLSDKPEALLEVSPKGTVPVLVLENGQVLDESLDIIHWALSCHDPDHWLNSEHEKESQQLIVENDQEFKTHLDHYKYADRFPDHPAEHFRAQGELFMAKLEKILTSQRYLSGNTLSITDIALFPFIRQFAHVDLDWFDQATYPNLQAWLKSLLNSELFNYVMKKQPRWSPNQNPIEF